MIGVELPAQSLVDGASLPEKCGPPARLGFQRGMILLLDFPLPASVHRLPLPLSLQATALSPASSRA